MIEDTSNIFDVRDQELPYSNSTKLRIQIENRLVDYGFHPQMSPSKYSIYNCIRRLISLRMEKVTKFFTDKELDTALLILDEILPRK